MEERWFTTKVEVGFGKDDRLPIGTRGVMLDSPKNGFNANIPGMGLVKVYDDDIELETNESE